MLNALTMTWYTSDPVFDTVLAIGLAMAPLTRSRAFRVAPSGSSLWTQLHCSRMFTTSKRAGLRPTSSRFVLKVSLCMVGVQHARTTLSSLRFSTAFLMASKDGLEQRYRSSRT